MTRLRQLLATLRVEWFALLAIVPVIWHVGALAWAFAVRMIYPMDIEWMEGGQLYHAHRILHGQPIFAAPQDGFVPFGYPPLHAAVLAAFGAIVGLDYWSARLISVACFVAICVVVVRQIARHGGGGSTPKLFAVAAIGLVAAGFPVTGGWYDLARNDSLALALPIVAAALVTDKERLRDRKRWVAVALLLVATVFAKQTGVFFAAWIGVFVLVSDHRIAIRIGVLAVVVALACFFGMQLVSHGWFLKWVLVMRKHSVDSSRAVAGAKIVLEFAPYLVLVPVLVVVLARRRWLSCRALLWFGMLACAFPAGLLPYAKSGGFLNNLMPMVVLAGPVALILALDLVVGLSANARPRAASVVRTVVLGGTAIVLVAGFYPLAAYVPGAEQRAKVEELNATIRALEGGVLAPQFPWLVVRNGHAEPQIHEMGHTDAVTGGMPRTEMERYIAASDARWVVGHETIAATIRRSDWFAPKSKKVKGAVKTMTGLITGPTRLYRRVARKDRSVLFDFEGEDLAGWQATGIAFSAIPRPLKNRGQRRIFNARGSKLLSSFDETQKDAAVGRLASPEFVLDQSHIGLLVGGGKQPATRVALVVDGQEIYSASGQDSEVLQYVGWDVSKWRGRTAHLELVDESVLAWGHILCDEVETFSIADRASWTKAKRKKKQRRSPAP